VQLPSTSLAEDIEKTRNLVASLEGPTLLVGHSYGGMIITDVGNAEKYCRFSLQRCICS
jgi:pimeloyl-ACP methyl ester carboxylesterase